jgi:hypothetical protein
MRQFLEGRRLPRAQVVRFGAVASVLAAAAAIIPGVAGADPAVPKGVTVVADFPAGEVCPFPVNIVVRDGTKIHDTGQGDIIIAGPLSATVTNTATGATQSFNASGPLFITGGSATPTVGTGPQLISQPASRNVGPPFLIYTTGRVTFTAIFTIESFSGRVTDVCAELS